jgi:hypothetical protein
MWCECMEEEVNCCYKYILAVLQEHLVSEFQGTKERCYWEGKPKETAG